jgi:hypothetical protein
MRNALKILVTQPDGKRSVGKLRCRWEDNIKTEVKETGSEDVDWIQVDLDSAQ